MAQSVFIQDYACSGVFQRNHPSFTFIKSCLFKLVQHACRGIKFVIAAADLCLFPIYSDFCNSSRPKRDAQWFFVNT